jgi:hypothetical protein
MTIDHVLIKQHCGVPGSHRFGNNGHSICKTKSGKASEEELLPNGSSERS